MPKRKTRSKSKTEKHSYPTLLVMKYMGSKKAILDFVATELTKLTEPDDIIVDLMAGTHTIGYAMKHRCKLVANDIQRYSRVIGETLLNYNPNVRFDDLFYSTFRRFYLSNLRHLAEIFTYGLLREEKYFDKIDAPRGWAAYADFCENYPHYMREEPSRLIPEEFSLLFGAKRIEAYQTLNKLEPYSLFSLYYANTYIGVEQAAAIDSLRFAIDKLCDQWLPDQEEFEEIDAYQLKCFLISSLIGVLNKINPGPGHWAAFPHVSEKNCKYLANMRRINVWDVFFERLRMYEDNLMANQSDRGPHIVMTEDYVNFMEEVKEYIRRAKVVYLDPPYSQGHYSRFYHLIETLTLYDYPEIKYQGRYRLNRHQSPFAHKEKVGEAIGKVCEIAQEGGAILVSSYSKGGVLPDDEAFINILRQYYPEKKIDLRKLTSVHSKLGQAKRMKTEEYLFICQP